MSVSEIITINPFDVQSIEAAFSEVSEYKAWLDSKCEEFSLRLCEAGSEAARSTYGGAEQSITITVEKRGKGAAVVASGAGVGFVEFGTGAHADSAHPFAQAVPFDVSKGSWSEVEGKGTWGAWIAAGKDEALYPYNTVPRRGMLEATKTIQREINGIARRVFMRG